MPLRIGFDMDGVLADFASTFREYGIRLFGPVEPVDRHVGQRRLPGDQPETEEARQAAAERETNNRIEVARALRRREDKIWQAIESTPDFWATLKPTEDGIVRRVFELTLRHRWEVFFITQRPSTEGETVQRQTQRWLVDQGFDLPSVLVISGSRGAAAKALRLDYHVDDNAQNCFDIVADSTAKPILVVPAAQEAAIASARKLGIGVTHGVGDAVNILDQATLAQTNPSLLKRIASMVGWKSS
jgi:phosphoserine phosphatase